MPTREALKWWFKDKLGLPESSPPHSSSANKRDPFAYPEVEFTPKPKVEIHHQSHRYITYLKQIYTDVTYNDLTATLNHRNGTDFTAEDVATYHTYLDDEFKREHERLLKIGSRNIANFKDYDGFNLEFCFEQTDGDFNKPISDLARCRRELDEAMAQLGRSIPPNAPILQDDRSEAIERLSRWRKYPYVPPKMQDSRDLSAADLKRIYEAREVVRKEHCDKENLEYDYLSRMEPPQLRPEYRRYY
ncbi:MAG: hypothetical protein Q9221_006242 [Calogaya cf. arnoldii]